MKCPYCNAEVSSNEKKCPYCKSELTRKEKEEQKSGINASNCTCPQCASHKIRFTREYIGDSRTTKSRRGIVLKNRRQSSSQKQAQHTTVAICQDCGCSWYPNTNQTNNGKKKHGVWWWILIIIFYPISIPILTIKWFYNTDKVKLNKWAKLGIGIGAWILLYIVLFPTMGNTAASTSTSTRAASNETVAEETLAESITAEETTAEELIYQETTAVKKTAEKTISEETTIEDASIREITTKDQTTVETTEIAVKAVAKETVPDTAPAIVTETTAIIPEETPAIQTIGQNEVPTTENAVVETKGNVEYNGRTVYVFGNGEKYHYSPTCRGSNPRELTLGEAEALGYGPCGTCVLK